MKIKLFTLVLALVFFSCKEEKAVENIQNQETEEVKAPSKLVFEIDLETTQPDDFKFFANDVFLNNNQFMNISINQKLNSNETSKSMRFEFPENIKPDVQLGFSLGTKKVKDVKITKSTLSYGETEFVVTPEEFNDFYTFNRFIDYNEETQTLQTKKIGNQYNPMLFVRRKILDSIQNIN